MLTPQQARYLLELVLKQELTVTLGDVLKGVSLAPHVKEIIAQLNSVINTTPDDPVPETPKRKAGKATTPRTPDNGSDDKTMPGLPEANS